MSEIAILKPAPEIPPRWYALTVRHQHERQTERALRSKGLETLVPLYRSRRQWSDRVQELELPLFAGYVLCRFPIWERIAVLSTPGVASIVGFGGKPAPLEDAEIAGIEQLLASKLALAPWPYLKAGDRVRVVQGAVGAALAGMRPIVFHPRMDFLLLAMDPVVNQAANWSYMFAGQASVPLVIRAVVNRGGEQGAQHSQALHALFMHVPGLKTVMPATPADAKGLLIAAVEDPNPVLYIDDRWLYAQTGPVPEKMQRIPIGQAVLRRRGRDLTIVAISWMAQLALQAADELAGYGVEAEVIDLRSLKPWDQTAVLESASKTGRVIVADPGWRTAGASAEIAATITEQAFHDLRAPVERVTLPDAPAPTSRSEETAYYPQTSAIIWAALRVLDSRIRTRRDAVEAAVPVGNV